MSPEVPLVRRSVLSPLDVSRICNVSQDEVRKWIADGSLPSFEVLGGHRRIRLPDLEKFMVSAQIPPPNGWSETRESYRVLIAEDEVDLLEIVAEMLREDPRFEVIAESSGFAAALTIARWIPDVILLDFVMPGMDGFEVCRKLRKDPYTCDIPVIAFTSLSQPENRDAVNQAGISSFLGKPFQSDKLFESLRQSLGIQPLS